MTRGVPDDEDAVRGMRTIAKYTPANLVNHAISNGLLIYLIQPAISKGSVPVYCLLFRTYVPTCPTSC